MKLFLGPGSGATASRIANAGGKHVLVSYHRRAETKAIVEAVKSKKTSTKKTK
jgi:hypothetical protein